MGTTSDLLPAGAASAAGATNPGVDAATTLGVAGATAPVVTGVASGAPVDVATYRRDGYLVLRGLLEGEELEALRAESVAICRGERGAIDGAAPAGAGDADDDALRRFPYADADAVALEVEAGGVVLFDGYLLHRSLPNNAPGSLRRAVANHYMSARSLLPWRAPREGEHMAIVDDRDIVLVAGEDPYAWKGTEERHRPYLRPDRDGGCDR
jgi:hypothetical protein